jgi:hypothetical protein
MLNKFYRKLPLFNFTVTTTAFSFQITILYPWHKRLSLQIEQIQSDIKKINNK